MMSRTINAVLAAITEDPDRGDVPGWVMVTVMSAALVVAILGVASPQLTSVFSDAVSSVTGK
jgi:hypothetical protein